MGQKVNPKIFRLGIFNNDWKLKYIENKISESSSIFFKAFWIKNYLIRILRFHGLRLHDYKISLSSMSLHIKASYIVTQYSLFFMDKEKEKTGLFITENQNKSIGQEDTILLIKSLMGENIKKSTDIRVDFKKSLTELKNKKFDYYYTKHFEIKVIMNRLIFKVNMITSLTSRSLNKKLVLLYLLITVKKNQLFIKKYRLALTLKKYNLVTVKKRECYLILYYFLKLKKKLRKNFIINHFRKLCCLFMKLKRTIVVIERRFYKTIDGFFIFASNIIIKNLFSRSNEHILLKKLFLLLLLVNFNKHFRSFKKKPKINQLIIIPTKQQKKNVYFYYNNYCYFFKKTKKYRYIKFPSFKIRYRRKKPTFNRGRKKPVFNNRKKPVFNRRRRKKLTFNRGRKLIKNLFFLQKKITNTAKTKRLIPTYFYYNKKQHNKNFYKNNKTTKAYSFITYLLNNLKRITNKKSYSIFLNFQHIDMTSIFTNIPLKKKIIKNYIKEKIFDLKKRYKRNEFLEESIIVVLAVLTKTCSARFLANYISSKLHRLVKKQRFFLKFIKKIFDEFIGVRFSKINGVKITFRGRTDKKSRKQINKVLIGNLGLQKLESNVDNAKATSYTPDGSIGIEIWITYNKKSKIKDYVKKK